MGYCGRSVDDQNEDVREDGKVCVLEVIRENTDFTGNWTRKAIHTVLWLKQYKQQKSAKVFRI